MKPGEITRRRRAKAFRLLKMDSPHFTTTEALCLLGAGCGAVKFHRILAKRGHAERLPRYEKGYRFTLPANYGGQTLSIKDHHSFQWTCEGVKFIASILKEERITHAIPSELLDR